MLFRKYRPLTLSFAQRLPLGEANITRKEALRSKILIMSKVFVLDTEKRPLDPIHSAQARQLLRNQKAAVYRRFPFTIILKDSSPDAVVQALRLKIDPGAKFTGFSIVNDVSGEVVFAAELQHRGFAIRESLTSRRQLRSSTSIIIKALTPALLRSLSKTLPKIIPKPS